MICQRNSLQKPKKNANDIQKIPTIKPALVEVGVQVPQEVQKLLIDFKRYFGSKLAQRFNEVEEKANSNPTRREPNLNAGKIKETVEKGICIAGGYISDLVINEIHGTEHPSNDIDIFIWDVIQDYILSIERRSIVARGGNGMKLETIMEAAENWIEDTLSSFFDGGTKKKEITPNIISHSGYGENPEVVKGVYEASFENYSIDVIFSRPKKRKH